jgi:8-oxo-dGTP diphosphatase
MSEKEIAVGVLVQDGACLIGKRQAHQHLGGLWEFPGGKVAPGEAPEDALIREFKEEVGVVTHDWRPLIEIPWVYKERSVRLKVYQTDRFEGTPFGREGQALNWCPLTKLNEYAFPPANQGILAALQLPQAMMITGRFADFEDGLARLKAALDDGVRLVQLRAKNLDEAQFMAWAREAIEQCHEYGAQVLINGPAKWLAALPEADGLQLSSQALMALTERPEQSRGKWLSVSVHTQAELAKALELEADCVLLSPVQPTASHPDMTPLGWAQFAKWVKDCPVPVYALGGVKLGDVNQARASGGQGIAAISGLWPQPL